MSLPPSPASALARARARLLDALGSPAFVPLVLALAVALRLAWVAVLPVQPVSDCRWYFDRALGLAGGHGYAVGDRPTAFYPVGYPAVLAGLFTLLGPSLAVAKLANVGFQLGILLLSYRLAVLLFGSVAVGRITLAALAVYPNHLSYTALTCSESASLFVLLAGIALMSVAVLSWPRACLAGATFALATVMKPQVVLLPVLLGVALIRRMPGGGPRRRYVAGLVLLYLVLAAALAPWIGRNYRVFDAFVFISTNGGVNLLVGNHAKATGMYSLPEELPALSGRARNEHEKDIEARRLALRFMLERPADTVRLWPWKLYHLYGRDGDGLAWSLLGIPADRDELRTLVWRAAQINRPYYWALLGTALLSILGLTVSGGWSRLGGLCPTLGLWVTVYFTAVYLPYFGDPRFHFPVMPWLAMYAGVGLHGLLTVGQSRDDRAREAPDRAAALQGDRA